MRSTDLPADVRDDLARLELIVFDFDGVFTDNQVIVDENGVESVVCTRADGFGVSALQTVGIETLVLSTEPNPVVSARCEKLRIRCIQGLDDKASVLIEELVRLGVSTERAAYVGNDVNDIACLAVVGVPIVVADAHPSVVDRGRYVTQTLGGRGAVREICDLIIDCRSAALEGV